MRTDYSEMLKSPLWQKRRLQMLEKAGWKCELCQRKEKTLHVHHLIYRAGHLAWEYEDKELVVLCECCHETVHERDLTGSMVLLLISVFKAGARHAVRLMNTEDDGSEELLDYLKALNS